MSAQFEDRDHVIGVLFRFEIENQRRKSENAQCRCGKNCTFKTRGGAVMQNSLWRARGVTEIVRNLVEETLDAGWGFQRS